MYVKTKDGAIYNYSNPKEPISDDAVILSEEEYNSELEKMTQR